MRCTYTGSRAGLEQALEQLQTELPLKSGNMEKLGTEQKQHSESLQKLADKEKELISKLGEYKLQKKVHPPLLSQAAQAVCLVYLVIVIGLDIMFFLSTLSFC